MTGESDLRSTDVYPYLARKGLVEKDRHNGLRFRQFLNKLKDNDLLKLIPQCVCIPGLQNEMNEWHFYTAKQNCTAGDPSHQVPEKTQIIVPAMTESEIQTYVSEHKPLVEALPKRLNKVFTPQELDTRRDYPRAYETWTDQEITIMNEFYLLSKNIDKVAQLLKRQPSAVAKRLLELGVDFFQNETQKKSSKIANPDEWETMILDPGAWYENYIRLKHVADTLSEKLIILINQCTPGKNRLHILGHHCLYMYCVGIALENLLKGRAIELYLLKNPKSIFTDIRQIKKEVWHTKSGHELQSIAESVNIILTDEENDFVRRLEVYISWAGKYPFGKSVKDTKDDANNNLLRSTRGDGLILGNIVRKINPGLFQ